MIGADDVNLSGNSTNGDFFGGLNNLADLAGKITNVVRGPTKPSTSKPAATPTWTKYLPAIGIGLVVLVVAFLALRKR